MFKQLASAQLPNPGSRHYCQIAELVDLWEIYWNLIKVFMCFICYLNIANSFITIVNILFFFILVQVGVRRLKHVATQRNGNVKCNCQEIISWRLYICKRFYYISILQVWHLTTKNALLTFDITLFEVGCVQNLYLKRIR